VIERSTLGNSATEFSKALQSDSLQTIFDEHTLRRWLPFSKRNASIGRRIDVLTASGPYSADTRQREKLRRLRAQRGAWEAYLDAAFACGIFSGAEGNDLCAKLRGIDEEGFRAAMAECMACWFLAGKHRLRVTPNPPGRNNCVLDLYVQTPNETVFAEVKAPYRERPEDGWRGDDADILAQRLADANKQFEEGNKNLLILVPTLRWNLFAFRDQLIKALFGHWVLSVPVDLKVPGSIHEVRSEFVHDGKLVSRFRKNGQPLKADGGPAHRRISAVLCIEERFTHSADGLLQEEMSEIGDGLDADDLKKLRELSGKYSSPLNQPWIEHQALLVHNPNAISPLQDKTWDRIPHLVDVNGRFCWSDLPRSSDAL